MRWVCGKNAKHEPVARCSIGVIFGGSSLGGSGFAASSLPGLSVGLATSVISRSFFIAIGSSRNGLACVWFRLQSCAMPKEQCAQSVLRWNVDQSDHQMRSNRQRQTANDLPPACVAVGTNQFVRTGNFIGVKVITTNTRPAQFEHLSFTGGRYRFVGAWSQDHARQSRPHTVDGREVVQAEVRQHQKDSAAGNTRFVGSKRRAHVVFGGMLTRLSAASATPVLPGSGHCGAE